MMDEFLEVFPDDLPGLSPNNEIEFGIDLVPEPQLVSIVPYKMAPIELTKLQRQFDELLEKGFIKSNTSS